MPARREREREEEPRRARLRSSSPTASHPKTDRPRPKSSSPTASLDRPRPRLSSPIALPFQKTNRHHVAFPENRSSSRRLSLNPVVIAAPIGFGDLACRRTQLPPNYEFFFSGCYLCF